MSSVYLSRTATTAADQFNAPVSAQLGPSSGKYWAISSVRVSRLQQPQFQPTGNVNLGLGYIGKYTSFVYPYCALHVGPTNVQDYTSFIDDTLLGSGDTSSIISGTIVSYGEAITAVWHNASIGGGVSSPLALTIYGREYDDLTELQQQLAPVPGARFSGTTANTAVWTQGTIVNQTGGDTINNPWFVDLPQSTGTAEIMEIYFEITTSATAGTRQFGFLVSNPDGSTAARLYAPGTQGASGNSVRYTFAQGISAVSGGTLKFQNGCIPSRLNLQVGSLIQLDHVNSVVGDSWDNLSVTYRQYLSFTNVSYT